MRTRALRPGFWEDSKMGELSVSARLTYAGLWCIADDAGFFELDVPAIGAALYRFDPTKAREKRVQEAIAKLVELGRVTIEKCGVHAVIPTIPEHRFTAGVQIYTIKKRHEAEPPAELQTLPLGLQIPEPPRSKRRTTDTSVSESDSSSDSSSDSLGMEKAPKRANGHAAIGSKDPTRERDEAIARARAKLDDPKTSADVKESARFALQRLGAL